MVECKCSLAAGLHGEMTNNICNFRSCSTLFEVAVGTAQQPQKAPLPGLPFCRIIITLSY